MCLGVDPNICKKSIYALLTVMVYIVGVWFYCKWRYTQKK